MTISLPFPPSVNHLFATVSRKRIKSEAYKSWLTAAGWELKAQKPPSITGPYRFTMIAYAPDKRRRDLDNLAKAPMDLLVKHRVVEDDHLCRSIHLEWADGPMVVPAHIRVTVEPAP